MKKIKYYVLPLLLCLLLITGCGSKKESATSKNKLNSLSIEETVNKVSSSITNLDNFKMNFNAGFAAKINDEKLDIDAKASADIDVKNKILKVSMSFKGMDKEFETEAYLRLNATKLEMYVKNPEDGKWGVIKQDIKDFGNVNLSLDTVLENGNVDFSKVINSEKVKQLDADEKNYNYEYIISSDDIKKILSENLNINMPEGVEIDEKKVETIKKTLNELLNKISGNVSIKFSIDKENYYVTKLSVDVQSLLDGFVKAFSGEDSNSSVSKANISLELTDINNISKIEIPSSVTENATEISE